ncbi:MAG: sulfite exporter TauE/SafE family protein [Mucinivorans sp.]
MDIVTIITLVISGIVVGVINTFAGAAAVITISLFSFLGLPLSVANATNRIPVIFQTVTMTFGFMRQGLIDFSLALKFAIPTVIGAVLGSEFVSRINNTFFVLILVGVLALLFAMLLFDPSKALKGRDNASSPRLIHYVLLLGIGFYGGAFHIGVGYLFLSLFIMGLGYNLLQANAMKGFVVLIYTIFSLVVFALNGEVNWAFGLVHGVGNIIGAYFATRYASHIPMPVLRYGLLVFIGLMIGYLLLENL